MSRILSQNKILYGGDYNPEQWDSKTRELDMELLPKAGVDIVTINVFSWASLQPEEDRYDFSDLDSIVKMVTDRGLNICMATSTGAHPAWMAKKYPDVTRVDEYGNRRKFGFRHNSCPNSPNYKKFSVALAGELAKRYKDQKNILVWHVNNEYGGICYCENCEKAFREYLKEKYKTLDRLNHEWNNAFWSHTFYDWDEIVVPNYLSELAPWIKRSATPSIVLEYTRFMSDSMLKNYIAEERMIKSIIPGVKVTTNFMTMFKGLDYQRWAEHMDLVSLDAYPQRNDEPAYTAFNHDIIRGLKQGQPFMLMESSPTVTSWLPVNTLKRPGQMREQSYQAVAHGADTVMFFQMRQGPASCEMYHGAILDHSNRSDTRCYKEVSALGAELSSLSDITLGGTVPAKTALIFDWDNWWYLEDSSGISHELEYTKELLNYYRALYELNVPVDVISMKDDLSKYEVIIAPLLYMIKDDIDIRLKAAAQRGATVLVTLMSGYVSESGRIIMGGYPGPLKDLCGIWDEETDMLLPGEENSFVYDGISYPARIACSIAHAEGAKTLASYESDFYRNSPAVTENAYGEGKAYYIATTSVPDFYRHLLFDILKNAGLRDAQESELSGYESAAVEMTVRENEKGRIVYALNNSGSEAVFTAGNDYKDLLSGKKIEKGENVRLPGYGVMMLMPVIYS